MATRRAGEMEQVAARDIFELGDEITGIGVARGGYESGGVVDQEPYPPAVDRPQPDLVVVASRPWARRLSEDLSANRSGDLVHDRDPRGIDVGFLRLIRHTACMSLDQDAAASSSTVRHALAAVGDEPGIMAAVELGNRARARLGHVPHARR